MFSKVEYTEGADFH